MRYVNNWHELVEKRTVAVTELCGLDLCRPVKRDRTAFTDLFCVIA